MLKSVFLKNFKCFEEINLPDLREMTILCGANNVGKSSVIQALVFLKDSILRGGFQWNAAEPQLGTFGDVVHKHDLRRSVTISCSFSLSKEDSASLDWLNKTPSEICYSVRFNRDNSKVEEAISFDGSTPVFDIDYRSGGKKMLLASEFTPVQEDAELTGASFNASIPLAWGVPQDKRIKDPTFLLLTDVVDILRKNFYNIYYLSPRRQISDWYADLSGSPADVGYKGESTSPMLHYMFSERDKTFDKIEKWLKRFDHDIKMLKSPLRVNTTAIVTSTKLGDMNIVTSGFGLSQVLPIVVQCLYSPPGSSILIEEPEIHLHSGAQKVLVDMFVNLLKERKQVLFTTHSFDILMDYYERIRDEKIAEDKVVRYDVLKTRKGKRRARKTDVYRYSFSGHGGWREQLRHLTERPP